MGEVLIFKNALPELASTGDFPRLETRNCGEIWIKDHNHLLKSRSTELDRLHALQQCTRTNFDI